MELIFFKLIFFGELMNHMPLAAHHDSNGCHAGDYMLVRRLDHTYENKTHAPQCEKLLGFLSPPELQSPGQCFKLACEVGANVIYFDLETECSAYQCDFNNEEHDWDYKWGDKSSFTGRTYALPHPTFSSCDNMSSHFVRRTWDKQNRVKSRCEPITLMSVNTLEECKARACSDKANTFNFNFDFDVDGNMDGHECETMYCRWNSKENDYDMNSVAYDIGRVEVYCLAHVAKACHGLQNNTIAIPLHVPRKCGRPGYFKNDLFIPNFFCDSGFNTFQHQNADSTYTTFKCELNDEGTEWSFYDDDEYIRPDFQGAEWLVLPPPGTPNCGSDKMFRLRRMRAMHQLSTCGHYERISRTMARDLRQCMLYACENGFNVINYYSTSTSVECDVRKCEKSHNGDIDFKYETTEGNHGYDVYALQSDPSAVDDLDLTTPMNTPATETPIQCTSSEKECNTQILVVVLVFSCIFVILIFVISMLVCKICKQRVNGMKRQRPARTLRVEIPRQRRINTANVRSNELPNHPTDEDALLLADHGDSPLQEENNLATICEYADFGGSFKPYKIIEERN